MAEDRELVQTLAQALEAAGISVWWDKKISAGGSWRETIANALNSAKVVIVAWSKRTEDSSGAAWVFNEVDDLAGKRVFWRQANGPNNYIYDVVSTGP